MTETMIRRIRLQPPWLPPLMVACLLLLASGCSTPPGPMPTYHPVAGMAGHGRVASANPFGYHPTRWYACSVEGPEGGISAAETFAQGDPLQQAPMDSGASDPAVFSWSPSTCRRLPPVEAVWTPVNLRR